MNPYLIVEGQKLEVSSIHYHNGAAVSVVTNINGVDKLQRLDSEYASLQWEGRFEPAIELIQKRIDGIEEIQTDIAHEYIDDDQLPFGNNELKERYQKNAHFLDGLIEAAGIIDEIENGEGIE